MGRRTGAGRGARGHGWTPGRGTVTLCAAAALATIVAHPVRAAPVTEGTPTPYAFAEDDTRVEGATVTTDAVRLDPGHTYRSALPGTDRRYYRLELDSSANAYVSATAVPGAGARVSSADGLKVSVQDAGGTTCSTGTAHFGPTGSPHPIAAWASRETGAGTYGCKGTGVYYVVVERRATGSSGSTSGDWDLELDYVSEPALDRDDATTPPGSWDSATPEHVLGDATRRAGGAGFAGASALGQGVWQDTVRPGQTLFYKVPVDWGQQLSATVEMGSSTGGDGFVGTALAMSLYNPVRAHVDDADAGYNGTQTSAALAPLPAVDHANRRAPGDRISAMRFAGWYYLAVHLGAPVADRFGEGPFGLTLRVRVSGTPVSAPAYLGRAVPRDVFGVTAGDREEAAAGATGDAGASGGEPGAGATAREDGGARGDGSGRGGTEQDTGTMRLVAAGGIGTGSVLVLGLVLWTAIARRRARDRWAG